MEGIEKLKELKLRYLAKCEIYFSDKNNVTGQEMLTARHNIARTLSVKLKEVPCYAGLTMSQLKML